MIVHEMLVMFLIPTVQSQHGTDGWCCTGTTRQYLRHWIQLLQTGSWLQYDTAVAKFSQEQASSLTIMLYFECLVTFLIPSCESTAVNYWSNTVQQQILVSALMRIDKKCNYFYHRTIYINFFPNGTPCQYGAFPQLQLTVTYSQFRVSMQLR